MLLSFVASVPADSERVDPTLASPAPSATLRFIPLAAAASSNASTLWVVLPDIEGPAAIEIPPPLLPEFDVVTPDSFEQAQAVESAADAQKAERLQAIYVKQIGDRVGRLLEMAAEEMSDSRGPCILYVIQNERGEVVDVDTEECQRDAQARQRLASAIKAASPLPPPPAGLAMGSYVKVDASAL